MENRKMFLPPFQILYIYQGILSELEYSILKEIEDIGGNKILRKFDYSILNFFSLSDIIILTTKFLTLDLSCHTTFCISYLVNSGSKIRASPPPPLHKFLHSIRLELNKSCAFFFSLQQSKSLVSKFTAYFSLFGYLQFNLNFFIGI